MSEGVFILFCEDCGERNRITMDAVDGNGRVRFECTSCRYMNDFPISIPTHDSESDDQTG